jgi:hypothetical protein
MTNISPRGRRDSLSDLINISVRNVSKTTPGYQRMPVPAQELQARLDAGHERFLAMARELREAKQREAQDAGHSAGH